MLTETTLRRWLGSSACVLAATPGLAWADGAAPLSVDVYQTVSHDSNVLRAPEGTERADWVSGTGLRLNLDDQVGRGKLVASLGADVNRYARAKELDYTGYQADVHFDWQSVALWRGTLGAEARQSQYLYDLSSGTQLEGGSLERNQRVYLRASKGVVTLWTLETEAEVAKRTYSNEALQGRDLQRASLGVGGRYQPSPDLQLRAMLRASRGEYPDLGEEGDTYNRRELVLGGRLSPSGATVLELTLVRASEDHSLQSSRSASTWQGSAKATWQATGKLSLSAEWARSNDTGEATSSVSVADAKQTDTARLAARWLISAKLQADLSARQSTRQLDSTFVGIAGAQRTAEDRTRALTLGISYQPIYSVNLACTLSREQRDVPQGASTGLTYAYAATVGGCNAQYTWR